MWHHTDFEDIKKHPQKLAQVVGRWITDHDPEQYVYDNWDRCVNCLVTGGQFENTNIPPGYQCKPWTIDELLAEGSKIDQDEGNWS